MIHPQTPGPGVHIMFELQHDQVSGADTETYRAKGNPPTLNPKKEGFHMFDATERSISGAATDIPHKLETLTKRRLALWTRTA